VRHTQQLSVSACTCETHTAAVCLKVHFWDTHSNCLGLNLRVTHSGCLSRCALAGHTHQLSVSACTCESHIANVCLEMHLWDTNSNSLGVNLRVTQAPGSLSRGALAGHTHQLSVSACTCGTHIVTLSTCTCESHIANVCLDLHLWDTNSNCLGVNLCVTQAAVCLSPRALAGHTQQLSVSACTCGTHIVTLSTCTCELHIANVCLKVHLWDPNSNCLGVNLRVTHSSCLSVPACTCGCGTHSSCLSPRALAGAGHTAAVCLSPRALAGAGHTAAVCLKVHLWDINNKSLGVHLRVTQAAVCLNVHLGGTQQLSLSVCTWRAQTAAVRKSVLLQAANSAVFTTRGEANTSFLIPTEKAALIPMGPRKSHVTRRSALIC
jgi:hypothetical protein